MTRQLFTFWQFNGDNRSFCNQKCPYCYGHNKDYLHHWNGNIDRWEHAFSRIPRDKYYVFSYGECMGAHGFYDCVDMIGRHPKDTLCIITNNSYSPRRLLNTQLAKDGRLYVVACWHPLGVSDREAGWSNFKQNLLMYKDADTPISVSYVWYKPQIPLWPRYFDWLDKHDFRVVTRRYVNDSQWLKIPGMHRVKRFAGKIFLEEYTNEEKAYLYASTCPKVTAYGLNIESSLGRSCSAGKDMILVKHNGDVALCACCYGGNHQLGNIFNSGFKLNDYNIKCPTNSCGGDFGMLHMEDPRFGELPDRLGNDNFLMLVEEIQQSSPVKYTHREEMLKCLEKLRC